MLALTGPSLEAVVKPNLVDEWKNVKPLWFADETPASQKEPGLLKTEFECDSGIFWLVININN